MTLKYAQKQWDRSGGNVVLCGKTIQIEKTNVWEVVYLPEVIISSVFLKHRGLRLKKA
jgi:hypothetical protein